jgi:HPt (histidine-containing phosphotransfer) domain-containing protein
MKGIGRLAYWVFAVLGAGLYALFQRNKSLKDELNQEKAERAVDQIKREIAEEEKNADDAEADYDAARSKFEHDGGGK